MSPIGAHVSIAGGYIEAFKRARAIEANALQIFTKSPRGGALRVVSEAESREVMSWADRKFVAYAIIHASYLLNLAKPLTSESYEMRSLQDDLLSADRLGADGVVLHIGKSLEMDVEKAKELFVKNVLTVLENTNKLKAKIILENTAGQGTELGYNLELFGIIFKEIKRQTPYKKRIAVCIDTQHTFASGCDLSTNDGRKNTVNDIEKYIGFNSIACVHLNDSKKVCGSRVDRHEDIGHGEIGENNLRLFVTELTKKSNTEIPLILETPEEHETFEMQIKKCGSWFS